MKKLSLILIVLCFLLPVVAFSFVQEDTPTTENPQLVIDSLNSRISALEKKVQEKSYTRIPNEDFENIIDNKIEKSWRETAKWWLFIIGAIVSVLGVLVNKYAKAYLQTSVDEKINLLRKENENQIKSISTRYFSSVIESLLDFKVENITKKNHVVPESLVDDLKNYLNDESLTIPESKKVSLIDTIMRCYYYNNYERRVEKMIDLIQEHETRYTLLQTTYANAAIAFSDMYDRYGSPEYYNSAVENCNKSIHILPDYGLAYALKLELCTMAMIKAFNDNDRKLYEQELRKVFKDIQNNRSTYICRELMDRFEVDKKTFMAPYLEKLYADFPNEIAEITERVKPQE